MSDRAAPQFIPSTQELTKLERDLRFHPSITTNPRALMPQQIASFNREGYLKGIRIFSPREIAVIREYFDRLLAQTLAAGGDSYSISTAHLRHGRVWDLLTNPRIVAIVTDLLGENTIGWGSHFFCKMPGDGKRVSWHQDSSYWPLTPSKAVTVWLAIDDADVENACMRYIPRSHVLGHLTYTLSEDDEANVLNQTVTAAENLGDPVPVELKAGEISIAQRPPATRLGGQPIHAPPLRPDATLLSGGCPRRTRLERQRSNRVRPRRLAPLGQSPPPRLNPGQYPQSPITPTSPR